MSRSYRYSSMLALAAAAAIGVAGCGSSSSGGGSNASAGAGTTPTATSPTANPSSSPSSASGGICGGAKGSGSVKVGAFNFPESEMLANIYAAALKECGYDASVKALGSREVVYPALKKGTFAVVPEYAATLTDFINTSDNGPKAKSKASGQIVKTIAALRAELPSSLAALDPAQATDKNSFAVKTTLASKNSLTTTSDLAAYSKSHPVKLGGPPECPTRPFCEPGLKSKYGLKFSKFVSLDAGGPLSIKALKSGKVDIALVFSSDPTLAASGLTVLDDDKHLQASDNIVPIVQQKYSSGAFASAINAVDQKLTQDVLVGLNKAVQVDRDPISQVATGFLQQEGLTA